MTHEDASYRRHRRAGEDFDEKYGVDTNPIIRRASLDITDAMSSLYKGYMPSRLDVFDEAIERLGCEVDLGNFDFLDIGAGKGRCLLLASSWPFRAIIGVEISPQLISIAQTNINTYVDASQRCTSFELVCTDVLDYRFAPRPSVLYMFNPFERAVVATLLGNIERSLVESPRKLFLVYQNPLHGNVFDESMTFARRFAGTGYVVYETDTKP
jgi:hypothetical protein